MYTIFSIGLSLKQRVNFFEREREVGNGFGEGTNNAKTPRLFYKWLLILSDAEFKAKKCDLIDGNVKTQNT